VLADAAPAALVTDAALAERLVGMTGSAVVRVDADGDAIAGRPDGRPDVAVGPDDLAYLIFTSGSTGRPKGVLLDHRGRVNNFTDFNRRFGVGPGDCTLALASIAFDMSAYDILGTLMCGARIALPAAGSGRDPAHWLAVAREHAVTVWHSVPALLEMLLESYESGAEPGTQQAFPPIRLVLLGGDWVPRTLPDRLRAAAPAATFATMGGATEVSMDSTIFVVDEVDPAWLSIPYGRPMANQRCFILDGRLQPVPVGVPGDLYLGGVGVGRGYLGDEELTRRRFLPRSPGRWSHERMYLTGDRARWRSDGTIELLGRSDFQLKVRGWRIEPGEVEAALRARDGVRDALVALSPGPGPRRLVGYVVFDGSDPGPDLAALREDLRTSLPDYMVPAVLLPLERFPLTANGKVDRKALPAPEAGAGPSGPAYVAPRNRTERLLAEVWQDLLGVPRVGVDDNFFVLGGDSITTIQVVSKARRLGIGLSPRQMFQHQTIAELAVVAEDSEMAAAPGRSMQIDIPSPREWDRLRAAYPDMVDAYPLSAMQRHMLRRESSVPRPGQYVIQVDYMFTPGGLDVPALRSAWQYIIGRHPTLRTSFHEGDDEPIQVVHADAEMEVRIHDLRGLASSEQLARQDEIAREDRERGFDLTRAPLLRMHLMRVDDLSYKYLFTNHHIVLDGWSRAIVQQEAFTVYEALLAGQEPKLPPLTSFKEYVAWLRGRDPAPAAEFWRGYLSGFDRPTPLVAHKGLPQPRYGREFAKQRVPMDPALRDALGEFCRGHRLTPNTVIQGAWLLLMNAYTGADEVVLGVTSSGRSTDFLGVETVTGLCMNTLPVRALVDHARPLQDWLREQQSHQVELRQHELSSVEEVTGRELVELFECQMVFENYPWDGSLSGLASRVDMAHPMAQPDYQVAQFEFPLRVEVVPGGQPLLIMHYYPGVFADTTVTQMIADWERTIAAMVAADDLTVGDVITNAGLGDGG
jgi:amino acid adenylation domain-containing protein